MRKRKTERRFTKNRCREEANCAGGDLISHMTSIAKFSGSIPT